MQTLPTLELYVENMFKLSIGLDLDEQIECQPQTIISLHTSWRKISF